MCFNPPALLFHPPPFSPPPPPPPPPQFYLVTGGYYGSFTSSTEILDPSTGVWQEAAPIPRQLWGLACGSPRPGSVVCAGGSEGFDAARDEVSDGHWPLGAL